MKKHLLPQKRAYKANMHIHSTFSDGALSPEEIKENYLNAGYSIVAFTDHEMIVPHNELRDERFLPITAYELSVKENIPGKRIEHWKALHLNLYSKDPNKTFSSAFSVSSMYWEKSRKLLPNELKNYECPYKEHTTPCINLLIKKAREEGFLVSYNHPVWSQHDYRDYIDFTGLWGIEVHNTECNSLGYRDTVTPWRDILRRGERIFPLATDDAHSKKNFFGGWIWVLADRLDYGEVMSALENGDFYASSGPEIKEISIDGNTLHIRTSPSELVEVNTERRISVAVGRRGELREEFALDLSRVFDDFKNSLHSPYIRVTVRDANGGIAYSRAYFLDEFLDETESE